MSLHRDMNAVKTLNETYTVKHDGLISGEGRLTGSRFWIFCRKLSTDVAVRALSESDSHLEGIATAMKYMSSLRILFLGVFLGGSVSLRI